MINPETILQWVAALGTFIGATLAARRTASTLKASRRMEGHQVDLNAEFAAFRSDMRGQIARLDGRIDAHERGSQERQLALNERHDTSVRSIERLEAKLDRALERGR